MNVTKKNKNTTKSVHITLLALLLIQVFLFHYFVLLWYVYTLVFREIYCWTQRGEEKGWTRGRLIKIQRNTHTSFMYSWLYSVYELVCAYSTQSLVFFFQRDNSFFILEGGGGSLPRLLVWSLIGNLSSSCFWVHFKKGVTETRRAETWFPTQTGR